MIKQIELHPTQFEVWEDKHRYKVVDAGRRWGKSILALAEVLYFAGQKEKAITAIVSPTFQQVKDIYWRDPQKIPKMIPPEAILKKNDSELFLQLVNGSYIYLRGSDRPDTLRGLRYDFVVLDEYASMKENIWEEIIQPTLLDSGGSALFISTPKGYEKFYDLWLRGQKPNDQWKSWKFTSYDNPYLEKEFIDQAKNDMDEDTFAQEILAEFKKYVGLVYKDFKREEQVIEPKELQNDWTYYRAIDFGFVNPTGVIFAGIDKEGVVYVYDEIYQKGLQTPDLAELIKQKSAGRTFINTWADSAQASDIEELRKYGLGITPVVKSSKTNEDWTTYRIRRVTEKLRNKKLFVFKNCENLIYEFENYQYHEVREGQQVKEVPMKINDHLLDALSYLIVSLPEWVEPIMDLNNEELPPDDTNLFKEGFY